MAMSEIYINVALLPGGTVDEVYKIFQVLGDSMSSGIKPGALHENIKRKATSDRIELLPIAKRHAYLPYIQALLVTFLSANITNKSNKLHHENN